MITRRDPKDGTITVTAKQFVVVVTEEGLKVQVGDVTVHEWKAGVVVSSADQPSPREAGKARKRGSR
jgi:hypothetical protein